MLEDVLLPLLGGYALVVVILLVLGLAAYADARGPGETKRAARRVFAAPLWPVVGGLFVVRAVRTMWQDADWKGTK